jgi:DNA-binding CsgD family transcriptional regulator
MTSADARDRGRESFERRAWGDAFARLSEADGRSPLEPEDLERLATAAYLIGRDDESARIWERAHREALERPDVERAVRCAFWLAYGLLGSGQMALGGGWTARAQRLLDDHGRECVERGYLLFPVGMQAILGGDLEGSHATFGRAAEIGERHGDRDLVALARHGQGRALIRMGRADEGLALLDEVMISVTSDEVSPIVAGDVYCSVIEGCQESFDLRRAQDWTQALSRWCESQPDLVPYRGHCLLHRAELMQLRGAWEDAMDEVRQASARLAARPGRPSVGAALYQQGELHRLRGEVAAAEAAYRQAGDAGREPQPGLARLWLAQGRIRAAHAAIRRAVDEADDTVTRSRLLPALVEVTLAADDVPAARAGAGELARIAQELGAPLLRALAAHAQGAVLLAEDRPQDALGPLRRAWSDWQELGAPYEGARVRVLLALACRRLGDEETARMELDAARRVFQRLGAAGDVARLSGRPDARTGGLTARELQVLREVAAGKTNRAIAGELFLSEKTVARHVSNILGKLGLPSRSAATAYAYENGLV